MTYSRGTAYLLWALCVFGVSGIHRLYLGKIGTGILWLCTWGLFGIGSIVDLFRIPSMVDEKTMQNIPGHHPDNPLTATSIDAVGSVYPIETVILRAARKHGGLVTPAEVAVRGYYSLDESKECLDELVSKGHAELRVRKTGGMIYVFPDLLTPDKEATVEPLT